LRRGRRRFTRGFSCPALLRNAPGGPGAGFRLRAFHPLWRGFPAASPNRPLKAPLALKLGAPSTPRAKARGLGTFPPSLAATDGIELLFFFLRLLRCFTSPGVASRPFAPPRSGGGSGAAIAEHDFGGVTPFGNPRVNARFAARRGLSQLTASFFASWRQGIPDAPLVACDRFKTKTGPLLIVVVLAPTETPPFSLQGAWGPSNALWFST
jgi:hypothetical protein